MHFKMATSLIEVLISKFNYSIEDAREEFREMRRRVFKDEEDPEEVLQDYGLEPDYVFDLLH